MAAADEAPTAYDAFIVHAWTKDSQLRLAGRLADGRSFAAVSPADPACVAVPLEAAAEAARLLAPLLCPEGPALDYAESYDGRPVRCFGVAVDSHGRAVETLARAGVAVLSERPRPAEDFLAARGIRNHCLVRGVPQAGRMVDLAFRAPALEPADGPLPRLRWLALDIETAPDGAVRAVSLAARGDRAAEAGFAVEEVLFRGPPLAAAGRACFATEAGLLAAFLERIRAIDPDVLTGWNVVDFDLAVLAGRCAALGLPFLLGRGDEAARVERREGQRGRCFVPGRQAIDAMLLVRASGTRFEDQSLDTVARRLVGAGKTVQAAGSDKLAELERLYRDEPEAFCAYCLEDSRLVLRILEKTGLDALTQSRAALTGVGLELAWTSIPAFERVYALELARRRVLPAPRDERRQVSGASGGMVLNPRAGLFGNVLVLDFRSLYPSIMRSFLIDPLSHERCLTEPRPDDVVAPNAARFRRAGGILPELVGDYFERRLAAQARGDETASFVYKILMNSFYGVLGSGGCRYARTELAGAVTSFGRHWLEYSRDWFEARGYAVLYGDTDSVFVASGDPAGDYAGLTALGSGLAAELNRDIAADIERRFGLASHLAIRCEKAYRSFLIPRMRSSLRAQPGAEPDPESERGRAKGYAGAVLRPDGGCEVEVKGMEAVRSDWTPLARRFQVELLGLLFGDRAAIPAYLERTAAALRRGDLDAELVYRKMLRRNAEDYGRGETPPVRAARLLGWTKRRGAVEYVMTLAGAAPLALAEAPIDYQHYVDHQLRPIWESMADAAGLDARGAFSRQGEFDW